MVLSAWAVLGSHSIVRLVGFGLSWCCPLGPLGRCWVVMVLFAWSVLGCHSVVRLVRLGGFGLSRYCPLGRFLNCHSVVRLFGPLGWFWVVMVLSVWSVLGYHNVVCLVRLGYYSVVDLGDSGLSWCCLLSLYGRFWVVMVLSVWSVLGRHGVVCLFWVVTVLSVWSDVRCHGGGFGLSWCCLLSRFGM